MDFIDFIDSTKLIESLKEHKDFYIESWGGFSDMPKPDKARVDEISRTIAEIVNFEKVRRYQGEWIDYSGEGFVECPICNSATNCDGNIEELHFCWKCGAKLKEGVKTNER